MENKIYEDLVKWHDKLSNWEDVEKFVSENQNAFDTYIDELYRLATTEMEESFMYEDFLHLIFDKFGRSKVVEILKRLRTNQVKKYESVKCECHEAKKQLDFQQKAALNYALRTTDPISEKNKRDELLKELAVKLDEKSKEPDPEIPEPAKEGKIMEAAIRESGGEYKK